MLIVRRKRDERVVIKYPGGRVRVTVTHLGSGAVKLGFEAGRDVVVLREELLPRVSPLAPNPEGKA